MKMLIYVIQQCDLISEYIHLHSAYTSEDEANRISNELNKEQRELERKYNEWCEGTDELDENESVPECGDYVFSVKRVKLHGFL